MFQNDIHLFKCVFLAPISRPPNHALLTSTWWFQIPGKCFCERSLHGVFEISGGSYGHGENSEEQTLVRGLQARKPHFSKKCAQQGGCCAKSESCFHCPFLSSLGALLGISGTRVCTIAVLMPVGSYPSISQSSLGSSYKSWPGMTAAFPTLQGQHELILHVSKKWSEKKPRQKFTHGTHLGTVISQGQVQVYLFKIFFTGMG